MFVAGRPTKLTAETHAAICGAIRAGNHLETSAKYAGINRDTLFDWLRRGRQPRLPENDKFRRFALDCDKSLATAEVRDVALIEQAAQSGTWTAAAWRLERMYPERYGRRMQEVHVSGNLTLSQLVAASLEEPAEDHRGNGKAINGKTAAPPPAPGPGADA